MYCSKVAIGSLVFAYTFTSGFSIFTLRIYSDKTLLLKRKPLLYKQENGKSTDKENW